MGLDVIHIRSDEDHYIPFICSICKDLIALDAVVTAICSHPFCKKCLEVGCKLTLTCPCCKQDIRRGSIHPDRNGLNGVDAMPLSEAQPLAYLCLSRVRVCCPDCHSWIGMYARLPAHQEDCKAELENFPESIISSKTFGNNRVFIGNESMDDDSFSDIEIKPVVKSMARLSHTDDASGLPVQYVETDYNVSEKLMGTSAHSQKFKGKRNSISNLIENDKDMLQGISNHSQGFREKKPDDEKTKRVRPSKQPSMDISAMSSSLHSSAISTGMSRSNRTAMSDEGRLNESHVGRDKTQRHSFSGARNHQFRKKSQLETYDLSDGEIKEDNHGKPRRSSLETGLRGHVPIPIEIKTTISDEFFGKVNKQSNDTMSQARLSRSSEESGRLTGDTNSSTLNGDGVRAESQDRRNSNESRSQSPLRVRLGLDRINESQKRLYEKDAIQNSNSVSADSPVEHALPSKLRKEHAAPFVHDNSSTSRHFATASTLKDQGNAKFNKGEYMDARKIYSEGINAVSGLQPASQEEFSLVATLYCNRGATNLKEKRYEETISDCDCALKFNPEHTKAYARKFRSLMSLGRFREARLLLETGLQHCPGDRSLVEDLAKSQKAEEHQREVEWLLANGDYSGALFAATQLVTLSDCEAFNCLAAKAEAANGHIDSAMKRCTMVLKENPRCAEGLQAKGFVFLMAADTEKAMELFHDSLKCDPDNIETKKFLKQARRINKMHADGRAAASRGEFKKAVEIFSLAMDVDVPKNVPLNSLLLTERADAYVHFEDYQAAVSDAKAAIEIKYDNVRAWVVRCHANIASDRPRDARRDILSAKRSWGSRNENIIDAYKRADFEARIQEADIELHHMVSGYRPKQPPQDLQGKARRRASVISAGTDATASSSATTNSDKVRRSRLPDATSDVRVASRHGDGEKQRRRQSIVFPGGGEARGGDSKGSDHKDNNAGPPVTRQPPNARQRRRNSTYSAGSSESPTGGLDVQGTQEMRPRKIKPMSEADARRRMSMI